MVAEEAFAQREAVVVEWVARPERVQALEQLCPQPSVVIQVWFRYRSYCRLQKNPKEPQTITQVLFSWFYSLFMLMNQR